MKKNLFILAALFITQLAQAKDYVFVIKGYTPTNTGKTIVREENGSVTDTLVVTPARDTEFIYVTLKDASGNVIESYWSAARFDDCFTIISPTLPTGYILEVRDDKGMVYREEE